MRSGPIANLLWQIRRLAVHGPAEDGDGRLLERFAATGDRSALLELMDRHGAMILGVCRRVLNDAHEAEDVFQATFLVLFRRAAALDRRASLASWLYTVAYHLALRARAKSHRLRLANSEVADMPARDPSSDQHQRELRGLLDEELQRLPAKYREPMVLCYLEGKTNEEAARQLGCPAGTIFTRLHRGRELLRGRLARRGLALSSAAIATGMSAQLSQAAPVPSALALAALEAVCGAAASSPLAAELTQEYLRSLALRRLRNIAAAVLIGLGGTAVGVALVHAATATASKPAIIAEPEEPNHVLGKHDGAVSCIAVSRNGTVIASGSEDRTARLWSASSGEQLHLLEGHENMVGPVAFSPDGRWLASGSADRSVIIWDAASGRQVHVLKGHTSSVRAIAYSPDGTLLASSGEDTSIIIRDAATGDIRDHFVARQIVFCLAFSPDSSLLAAGTAGPEIQIWSLKQGKENARLRGHENSVQSLAFTADGKFLFSAADDETIRMWELASGSVVKTLTGHAGAVKSIVLSPDGGTLASAGSDASIRLWDAKQGVELRRLAGHAGEVRSVAFSPSGQLLFSAGRDRTLRKWTLSLK